MASNETSMSSWLKHLPEAYAYHQVITDEAGEPVDFVYLQANPAFEVMTGLKAEDIMGKRVTEVLPGIESGDFDWIGTFGQVALTGESCQVEQYSKPLNRWYNVTCFSDKKGYFAVFFHDITRQKQERHKLEKLVESAQLFLDGEEKVDYERLAEDMRQLTGAAYVVCNQFDENGRDFTTKAIAGTSPHIKKAAGMLGFEIVGRKWPHDPDREEKTRHQTITVFDTMGALAGKTLSPRLVRLLEKTFDVGQMVIVKIMKQDRSLGDFTLIMPRGNQMEDPEMAALYASQAGLMLDRLKHRQDLHSERQRLANIIEGTHVGTWEWNVQTGETFFNERWAEITGYTLAEIQPVSIHTWTSLAHPEDLKASEAQLKDVFARKKDHYDIECRIKHKDGYWIWVQDRGKVISWTEDGKPLWMSGTHTDITERKQAEEALTAQRQIYEQILEQSLAGYWDWDIPTGDEYMSPTFKKMFGYEEHEMENKAESWQRLIFAEDLPSVFEKFNQHIESKGKNPFYNEVRYRHKNGSTVWVICTGKVIEWDHDGKAKRMIGCHIDITDRKQAEETLKLAKQQAETANEAKSRYLAHMNHEIRTPLNGFMGFLQLMELTDLDVEQKEFLHSMKQTTNHMLGIINNVLDYAEIEAGEMQLTKKPFNLEDEIHIAMAPLHSLASQNNTQLKVTIDNNLPHQVKGDPDRLRQILLNLGGNAVKFTRNGQVHMAVTCRETVPDHHAMKLVVEDTGPGMTRETLDKLFQPFYQADDGSVPQSKGTGLGMPITRELVELMDGTIQVESSSGKGTRVEVDLVLMKE